MILSCPVFEFRHFDPLTGNLPDPYIYSYVELLFRSRKILALYSSDEIKIATLAINSILKDQNFVDPFHEAIKQEPIKTMMYGQEYNILPSLNYIEAIYQNINNIKLEDHIQLNKFSWPHLFAIICIFAAEQISRELFALENWPKNFIVPKPANDHFHAIAVDWYAEAKQALTFAETIIKNNLKNKKKIDDYHASKSKPLSNLVFSIYLEKYSTRSNREAASKIFEELQENEVINFDIKTNKLTFNGNEVLHNDDPAHQFEKWIGKMKRNTHN